MRRRDYGFADRCEAVALPRRPAEAIEWGYAPKRFLKRGYSGTSEGVAPH